MIELLAVAILAFAAPCPDGAPQKLVAGAVAPCDGWLISEADGLHVAKLRKQLDATVDELARVKRVAAEELEFQRRDSVVRLDAVKAEIKACDERVEAQKTAIDKCGDLAPEPVPWYESTGFVAAAAGLAGAVLAVVVVVLVYEVGGG